MADFEDNGIDVDDWMNQQPVNCCQSICACCSSKRVRRRYARQALFKRLTVEELERRYQKHMSSLRPEEDQAVKQVIDDFKKGWYIEIQVRHWMETFYSPVSPLLALFFFFLRWAPWCMPITYIFLKSLCKKDDPTLCCTFFVLPLYPIGLFWELFSLMYIVLFMFVLLLLATPLELLVFLGGMCYYRCGRLRKCGVFVYGCKLKFIVAQGQSMAKSGNEIRIAEITKFVDGGKFLFHHASLCRTIFCNPITAIFNNLNREEYSYGDIQGVHLSTREVEMYDLQRQQSAVLQQQAISLVQKI